ncbi:hypothetical protein EV359DRAFT_33624 [Lentinula novae-zelandiae]|nr:hypothetical protein EV359DRAFT_33624 [Lentinula novae-zelandiae]
MGPSGSRHVTMGDLEDERRMREEDEEKRNEGDEESEEDDQDDDEVEQVLDLEERLLIAESEGSEIEIDSEDDEDVEDDDDGEDEDGDDDQSPRSSFQARLEHLRKRASSQTGATSAKSKGKAKAKATLYDDSDSDDEDDWDRNLTWAEADDDFIAHIQDILDENEDILIGRDKESKKQVFQAVYNGDFEDVDMWKPAPKDKHKDIPPDLVDLWKKDRAKKAIRKQERELARLAAAADPLTKKQGGKKGRKAMLAAAKLDPTIVVLPNRVIDMTTLVQQIRRFIDNIGGPSTMSLPPANKQTRKNVHELAAAFNLKSFSEGNGDARYTTLTKTTMSGIRVDQKKVARIVRRGGGLADNAEFVGGADISKKHAERGKAGKSMPKHREGDEVGKTAPKINNTNIGFKMLASMGWAEGDPIGQSGGLQNPLTAVIKNTKLGLGAMK